MHRFPSHLRPWISCSPTHAVLPGQPLGFLFALFLPSLCEYTADFFSGFRGTEIDQTQPWARFLTYTYDLVW